MSCGAVAAASVLAWLEHVKGIGAMTSLLLLGPALDLAVLRAKANWTLYLRFAAAGLIVNLLAFSVQMGAKAAGWSLGGGRDFQSWLSVGTISFPICGLIAGLVSGAIWFHWRGGRETSKSP